MFEQNILSILVFTPILGVFTLMALGAAKSSVIKIVALGFMGVEVIVSFALYGLFRANGIGMQFEVSTPWVESFGISYHLGIDGISLLLIILTTILTFLAALSAWGSVNKSVRGFYISILVLLSGMVGVFVSLDLFLFYVFWEVMLIPMYFLIGIWGGPRRIYASIKFVLFTVFGSLLMLVALLYLYFEHHSQTGVYSFDLLDMYRLNIAPEPQMWMFLAFALAFAIKIPMWPLHTWLPDAHVEAPTAGSVILAGVLLKMGTYGFLRICFPIFPEAIIDFAPLIAILAIIGVIYGALVAMVQKDIKSLVAFSSVSHLGFIMLGMIAFNLEGMEGSVLQMVNHGISTGALFLIVGMIYERRHTRMIKDFGGLASVMPVFSTAFMIVTLSAIGLPLTNGFVGEFLILLGLFKANWIYAAFATTGVVLAACYMLWMFQRVVWGKITNPANEGLSDLNLRERLVLIPLIALIFWIGVYPNPLLSRIEPAVRSILVATQRAENASEVFSESDLNSENIRAISIFGNETSNAKSNTVGK
ncbi:MAG: NADH-quinone oxidoreductase subunit M [candidate division Zixibacteria bacterium]|nr:NADH-quinone oxidoreductase subunit M [candidate division Zixibacteria bacterium]